MPEERAFGQFPRDRCEIHRDERCAWIGRLPMDESREQLLARATLSENEHCGRQLGDFVHQVDDVADRFAGADDEFPLALVGHLCRERQHSPAQGLVFAGVAHERTQLVVIEILGDVVIGPNA